MEKDGAAVSKENLDQPDSEKPPEYQHHWYTAYVQRINDNKEMIKKYCLRGFLLALLVGYTVFLVFACTMDFERAKPVFIITMIILGLFIVSYIWPYISPTLWKYFFNPLGNFYNKYERYMKW